VAGQSGTWASYHSRTPQIRLRKPNYLLGLWETPVIKLPVLCVWLCTRVPECNQTQPFDYVHRTLNSSSRVCTLDHAQPHVAVQHSLDDTADNGVVQYQTHHSCRPVKTCSSPRLFWIHLSHPDIHVSCSLHPTCVHLQVLRCQAYRQYTFCWPCCLFDTSKVDSAILNRLFLNLSWVVLVEQLCENCRLLSTWQSRTCSVENQPIALEIEPIVVVFGTCLVL